MQPKLLLILKRTHGGQRPEMVVQCGYAPCLRFFARSSTRSGFAVVRPDPTQSLCCRPFGSDLPALQSLEGAPPSCPTEDSVDDLALNQATQKGNVPAGCSAGPRADSMHRATPPWSLAGGHRGTIRRRLRRPESPLGSESSRTDGHFELE